MKELSFGDEYWIPNEKNREALFEALPLKLFKNIKQKKILEVGSGYGIYIYCLSKNNSMTGIEIDNKRVIESRKILKKSKVKAKMLQGDARNLPFKDKGFDAVFCHGVIEHFNESDIAIKEGYRVLKNNGIAMYSVPARFSFFVPFKLLQKLIDKVFKTNLWTCGFEKSFTPWKFKKLIRQAGFKILHFEISESVPGRRFPFIGKIMRLLDKPFWYLGIGGRFLYILCEKDTKE